MVQLVGSVLEAVSSRVCSGFFIEAKTERPKIDSRGGVLVDGKEVASPPHQLGCMGSTVSSSSGVHGGALTTQRFSTIFSTHSSLS